MVKEVSFQKVIQESRSLSYHLQVSFALTSMVQDGTQ